MRHSASSSSSGRGEPEYVPATTRPGLSASSRWAASSATPGRDPSRNGRQPRLAHRAARRGTRSLPGTRSYCGHPWRRIAQTTPMPSARQRFALSSTSPNRWSARARSTNSGLTVATRRAGPPPSAIRSATTSTAPAMSTQSTRTPRMRIFFSSRRRHTRSVSAFLLNRSSDLNVLPQLDINNTIDHRPEGDEKWFLENEKTVTQFCRKLAAERPLKDIRDEYNYPKKKGIKDECSRLLEASTMKSRRGFAIQRLMNAMRQAHADGWFIVFDTLTLADDRLEAFYDNPNALRDYFRDIGRMVLAAEGRKANDSHADCYQYFCVPEYGTANGRLHFHAVHFMRTLPTGSVDPNFGRRVRNRRQLNSLQNTWPYGYSMPIAVRYTQDAFSRSGWLWPVDAKGEPLKATSYMAVGFYVAKYVNKKSDMDLAAKGLGAKEWNNSLKTKLSLLPKKLFRIRMSRNFGMKMLTMTNLSTECLIQLTKLGYDATPFNQILKQNAKREMRLRLGKVTVADVLAAQPVTTNLLKFMRASIKMIGVSNLQSFIASMTQKLTLSDISDESKNYLDKAGITTACLRIKSKWTAGGK